MRLLLIFLFFCVQLHAQDTFYVKKKQPRSAVAQTQLPRLDTSWKGDTIITYTAEYKSATGNIWVIAHMKGPRLTPPPDAPPGTRILMTEIIAKNSSGRRYRIPDQYYIAGAYFPVKSPVQRK
jgi:hypothetical protein